MGFEIEDVYLAVLSYRHTEFEETPIIPLLFLLYDRDSPSVHDFFFLRVTELIPELLTARKAIIVSNEEPAVVEALEKNLPELPRFRCWFHALQTIRSKLQILEIEDRQEVQQYESDYLRLLNQASAGDYKTALGQMYLKKWKKVTRIVICVFENRVILKRFISVNEGILRLFRPGNRCSYGADGTVETAVFGCLVPIC